MRTQELIIAIHDYHDILGVTVLSSCSSDIEQCFHAHLVLRQPISTPIKIYLLQKLLYLLSSTVWGGIVDNNHLVIRILLPDDGLDVESIPILSYVLIGWHHQANGKLFVVIGMISWLIIFLLILINKLLITVGVVVKFQ